jgi:F-type H+-transporting ATPase subunit delta
MSLAAASRYARALADLVLTPGSGLSPEQAIDQLQAFSAVLASSDELRNIMLSPAVAVSKKHAVIKRLEAGLGFSPLIRNFLSVVVQHRRVALFKSIIESLELILDERLGLAKADISSASELSAPQRARLEAQLSRLAGKNVRCDYRIDPNLVGGAVARIGSTVYDGSLRGQLNTLRQRLTSGV